MDSLEERAVVAIQSQFKRLPAKSKPRNVVEGGVAVWVPLAGIAICKGPDSLSILLLDYSPFR